MTFTLNGAAALEPIASHIGNQKEKTFVQPDHLDVNVAEPVITKTGAASMNDAQEAFAPDVMADVVIIGTGPAGASLACFLASYGISGILLGQEGTSTSSPRAHFVNVGTLECLRDIGLDAECAKLGIPIEEIGNVRWAENMIGREYARTLSFGNGAHRRGDYQAASPCTAMDLRQTLLEPILVRYAALKSWQCRFDTQFISFVQNEEAKTVDVSVQDKITHRAYTIRAKYLFGADGARSQICRQLELPMAKLPGKGSAVNILVEADISHGIANRQGNLHWLMQPAVSHPEYGWIACVRMVKPWNEWIFSLFPSFGKEFPDGITHKQYVKRIKEFIGDEHIEVKILQVSKWTIIETYAELYSKGQVFAILGRLWMMIFLLTKSTVSVWETVHRHPPFNGLGSNTSIQDAYNLAWKVAYVLKGHADVSLLDSYNDERQPVGAGVVKRANQSLGAHVKAWGALGVLEPDVESRTKAFAELSEASPNGRKRRELFRNAIVETDYEFHGLGIEMNQRYASGAVYQEDQGHCPSFDRDPILYHQPTTYPGARLPHAWLNTATQSKLVSTIDLAGHGHFTLLTGIGGWQWKTACDQVLAEMGVPIKSYSIGFGQDLEDIYFEWEKLREVEESGCVLIRPDRFVAWRCTALPDRCEDQLFKVMRKILSRSSC